MLRFAALTVLILVCLLIVAGFVELRTAALSSAAAGPRHALAAAALAVAAALSWALV